VARVQESHKGHEIVIEEPAGGGGERQALAQAVQEPRLSIDGRPVKVIRNSDGTYSSEGVFYTSYPTLLDLARASIDILQPEKR
jgi:Tyrosinase co-factor MelC1